MTTLFIMLIAIFITGITPFINLTIPKKKKLKKKLKDD